MKKFNPHVWKPNVRSMSVEDRRSMFHGRRTVAFLGKHLDKAHKEASSAAAKGDHVGVSKAYATYEKAVRYHGKKMAAHAKQWRDERLALKK